MKRKESLDWLRALPVLALCVGWIAYVQGCRILPGKPEPGRSELPRVDPPAVKLAARSLLRVDPKALPDGARAHFPAYDGDRFYVTLPVRQAADVRAKEVREEVIAPILRAVGFERGVRGLSEPPERGTEMPRASMKGLGQVVADEYARSPGLLRPETQRMIDVLAGKKPADDTINMALGMGEGMNFAQYAAGIERLEILYPFLQVEGDVPIEHTGLLASRWEGQGVTSVRGVVFNHYRVGNRIAFDGRRIIAQGRSALGKVPGVESVLSGWPEEGPTLVLLPYDVDASGATILRYAYRMLLRGMALGRPAPILCWIDAERGDVLKLRTFLSDAQGKGATWNRDPGIGTLTSPFRVDPSAGGQYTLQLAGVLNRVDFQGDGYDAQDVSISDSTNGSSATLANFDQATINDAAQALCSSGTNKGFQQVHFFATLYRYYQQSLWLGVFTPFPTSPWNPKVESASAGCNAWSYMDYGACDGYFDATCPDFSDGTNGGVNFMNFAHDSTVVGHELAHNITWRMSDGRPPDWCGLGPCAIPVGWGLFHDLADFWADTFESTNCTGGWVGKNLYGVDAALNCIANHHEGGYLPRLHEVTVPFNPGAPGDHFPEHLSLFADEDPKGNFANRDYANGQIAAAALWQVRIGMRSKCRPSGLPVFNVRFARALRETGFLGFTPSLDDLDLYRMLYDLEVEMTEQWASAGSPGGAPAFKHNGPHTTNKVTGGFARTGLFLIPYQCVDGDPLTVDPLFCPAGENGADAVVDIDDNDPADDFSINGVDHPEWDFLEAGGAAPVFHVWTGSRFRFNGTSAQVTSPCPCNVKFQVEVSGDPTFPPASTVASRWIDVDLDPTTPASPECYGTWSPTPAEWTTIQGFGMLIHYRARTRDAADGNEHVSTLPGKGLWTVPPARGVVTPDGKSDY